MARRVSAVLVNNGRALFVAGPDTEMSQSCLVLGDVLTFIFDPYVLRVPA